MGKWVKSLICNAVLVSSSFLKIEIVNNLCRKFIFFAENFLDKIQNGTRQTTPAQMQKIR